MSTVATNDDDDEDKEEESEAVDKNENKIDAKKLTRKEAAQELFLQVTYCTINITNLSDYFDWIKCVKSTPYFQSLDSF